LVPQQEIEFELRRRKNEAARTVRQRLRMGRVTLHRPTGRRGKLRCQPVEVTVLYAEEIDPPSGKEPVHWWLRTDYSLESFTEPSALIRWYLLRWQIEIFFKILKSGCRVEQLQLRKVESYEPYLAMYMIIAWHILYLTSLSQQAPQINCRDVMDETLWKTAWVRVRRSRPPDEGISIKEMIVLIAQLSGYLARKSDSPPGPKAIWSGLKKLYHVIEAQTVINHCQTYG